MKRRIITIALVAMTGTALSQGTVYFANATSDYRFSTPDHLLRWGPVATNFNSALVFGELVSSNYNGVNLSGLRAQLFYGSSTEFAAGSLTAVTDAPVTFRSSTSPNAGAWLGGTRILGGFQPGDRLNLSIVVWDVNMFADPKEAIAADAILGWSGIFSYTIPTSAGWPWAYHLNEQPPFFVFDNVNIPEPDSGTLIGLGILGLLLCRGRKTCWFHGSCARGRFFLQRARQQPRRGAKPSRESGPRAKRAEPNLVYTKQAPTFLGIGKPEGVNLHHTQRV